MEGFGDGIVAWSVRSTPGSRAAAREAGMNSQFERPELGAERVSQRLRFAFLVTLAILAIEVVGGVASNSLALLSDAGHVLTDVLALGLSWFAAVQAERPPTRRRTFGFHRAGILAALANAVTLVILSIFIVYEAYRRLVAPQPVEGGLMFAVALVGLAANVGLAAFLHRGEEENLNVRSATLHVLGDALASVVVVIGAVVIYLTGFYAVDPLLSVVVALIIVGGGWSIISETVNILMEGTPSGLDVSEIVREMKAVPGILDVHDLHVWSLAAGVHALSCHVVVTDQALSQSNAILLELNRLLAGRFGIYHTTIQFEHRECGLICTLFHDRLAPESGTLRARR